MQRLAALVLIATLGGCTDVLAPLAAAPGATTEPLALAGTPAPANHTNAWYHGQWSSYDGTAARARPDYVQHMQEAIPLYEQATREYPTDAWLWVFYGFALRVVGRTADGFPPHEKAYALAPTDAGIVDNVKYACLDVLPPYGTDVGIALRAQTLLQKIDPKATGARDQVFVMLLKAGRYADARTLEKPASSKDLDAMSIFVEGAIDLYQGITLTKLVNAPKIAVPAKVDPLAKASDLAKTYEMDHRIGLVYRGLVDALPYDQQMASPYQDKVRDYEVKAVGEYFALHPFTQQGSFQPPLHGTFYLGQGAGGKSYHYGLDAHYAYDMVPTPTALGTTVYAVAAGTVRKADFSNPDRAEHAPVDLTARANYVVIDHGNGVFSKYVHVKQGSGRVSVGDRVTAGQAIALVGNSGVTTGPHLHFQFDNEADPAITWPVQLDGLTRRPSGSSQAFTATRALEPGFDYKF